MANTRYAHGSHAIRNTGSPRRYTITPSRHAIIATGRTYPILIPHSEYQYSPRAPSRMTSPTHACDAGTRLICSHRRYTR